MLRRFPNHQINGFWTIIEWAKRNDGANLVLEASNFFDWTKSESTTGWSRVATSSSILPKDLEGMVSKAEKEGRIPLTRRIQLSSRFCILLNQAIIIACSIAYHWRTKGLRYLKSDHPFHGISESLSVFPINASCPDVQLEGPRFTEDREHATLSLDPHANRERDTLCLQYLLPPFHHPDKA